MNDDHDVSRQTYEKAKMSPVPIVLSLGVSVSFIQLILIVFMLLAPIPIVLAIVIAIALIFYLPVYFIAYRIGKITPYLGTLTKSFAYVLLIALLSVFPAIVCGFFFSGWMAG